MGRWALRIAIGLWAVGVVLAGVLLLFHPRWQMLDPPYAGVGLFVAPPVVATIVVIFRAWKERGPRIGATAGVINLGLFTFASFTWGLIPFMNAALDDSAAVEHRVRIMTRMRKRASMRAVGVTSWRGDVDLESITVDADVVDGRDEVIVTTRRGGLGFEWVERVRRAD